MKRWYTDFLITLHIFWVGLLEILSWGVYEVEEFYRWYLLLYPRTYIVYGIWIISCMLLSILLLPLFKAFKHPMSYKILLELYDRLKYKHFKARNLLRKSSK